MDSHRDPFASGSVRGEGAAMSGTVAQMGISGTDVRPVPVPQALYRMLRDSQPSSGGNWARCTVGGILSKFCFNLPHP